MVYLCTVLHTYIHEAYLYTYRTAKYFTPVTIQTGWNHWGKKKKKTPQKATWKQVTFQSVSDTGLPIYFSENVHWEALY